MAEDLCISNGSKEEGYRTLFLQVKCLIANGNDLIANLTNVTAALKEAFGFFWIGFYLIRGEGLVLAPFQGPMTCTRIEKERGVYRRAWERAETLVVPDMDAFPGHITCSFLSHPEIVVPLFRTDGELWGVLNTDYESLNSFGDVNTYFLRELCSRLQNVHRKIGNLYWQNNGMAW